MVRLAFFIEHQDVFNEHAFSIEVIIVYFVYFIKRILYCTVFKKLGFATVLLEFRLVLWNCCSHSGENP